MSGTNNNIGQNWLLLRGLARESGHWGDFIPQLQSHFPNSKISVLDLPGTGQFHQENSPNNIKAITEITRQRALERGLLDQPITLFAVSLGGMVAWEWLSSFPEDICGGTLVNTSFANLSPFYQRLKGSCYPQFISLLGKKDLLDRERAVLQLVSNNRSNDEPISIKWADIQTQRPITLKNCFQQIMAAATFKPTTAQPTQPILLLNSIKDRLVSVHCSEAIQQHYQLPIQQHPWAGHDLTLDDPQWVIQQLQQWTAHVTHN